MSGCIDMPCECIKFRTRYNHDIVVLRSIDNIPTKNISFWLLFIQSVIFLSFCMHAVSFHFDNSLLALNSFEIEIIFARCVFIGKVQFYLDALAFPNFTVFNLSSDKLFSNMPTPIAIKFFCIERITNR